MKAWFRRRPAIRADSSQWVKSHTYLNATHFMSLERNAAELKEPGGTLLSDLRAEPSNTFRLITNIVFLEIRLFQSERLNMLTSNIMLFKKHNKNPSVCIFQNMYNFITKIMY